MRISISSLREFKSCRRAYELKYVEGLEPIKKAESLQTGLSYHAMLEELYRNGGRFELVNFSKEEAMAMAYAKYIYPRFKVTAVEEWFSYQLSEDDLLVGRIDGYAEDGYLVEHKTTSAEITEEYEYNLQWDEQILAYMLATGTRKMWYTVVRKPTIRQKRGETDEQFFDRMVAWYDTDTDSKVRLLEIRRCDAEVEAFGAELKMMCQELKDCYNNGRFYRNTRACNMWGRRCEYASVCKFYDREQEYVDFVKNARRAKDGN